MPATVRGAFYAAQYDGYPVFGCGFTQRIEMAGFDLNRIFNELPIVAIILTLTEAGALLLEALARSNDQQLAGAIIFLLTATIVGLNFVTDVALAALDPRMRNSVMGGRA